MRTLILALSLYTVGVASVLYVRPSAMFHADGRWREFGVDGGATGRTPTPFYMFALVWALGAYGLALVVANTLATAALPPTVAGGLFPSPAETSSSVALPVSGSGRWAGQGGA